MNRYDELTKDMDIDWHHFSRSNFYNFNTSSGFKNIIQFVKELDIKNVLDYGCGNNNLQDILNKANTNITCVSYDPYIAHFSTKPNSKKELTVCYNVLQIVEEHDVDNVINDLYNLTEKYLLLNVTLEAMFHRNYDYYINLFEKKYSNFFTVLDKHNQLDERIHSRKNLDTNEIYLHNQFKIRTGYFLLKII
jgi:hypothetical protein